MTQIENANTLGLVSALQAIEANELSALDIINACFSRISARENDVGSWQHLISKDDYLSQYHANEAFYRNSPLKGLPVGIKDIIDTKGMPTEMGSPIHQGRIPVDDATCVELIKQAGGIVLGKTVTTEFAYFKPGKTHNPADLRRTPGGSSSGSAAAVADSMVPMSVGSQTAASVIRPAAYCGVIGYVASRGELSLRGGQPLAQSLDSLGLFARHAEDLLLLRDILLRRPIDFSNYVAQKPTSILLCQGELVGDVEDDMTQALNTVASSMIEHGIEIVNLQDQGRVRELVRCHEVIMAWEVCRNLAYESRQSELMSEPLQQLIKTGLEMAQDDYYQALDQVAEIEMWLSREYPNIDAILAPAAAGIAPLGHDKTGSPHMSRPWQVLGVPTATLTGVLDSEGIPLGLQLVGKKRRDDALLKMVKWFNEIL